MARDGDVPTIFNPKRVRTPSVIITTDEVASDHGDVERERPNGPPTPLSPRAPLTPQTSVSSAPPLTTQPSLQQAYSESAGSSQDEERQLRDKKCPRSCCSKVAKKMYYGLCVTTTVVVSWVMVTHCIKYMYLQNYSHADSSTSTESTVNYNFTSRIRTHHHYNAPFFTAWFCTNWLILFYPLYIIVMLIHKKCKSANSIVSDAFTDFKDKGFTFARFLSRCGLFCLLWVVTIYMYTYSLRILLSTDVVALFATNVSCVYLLSWVILHEQFVGVRIVAAILCDTGIALLAYMDGITGSSTLGGVVLSACAAAGFAIFKIKLSLFLLPTCTAALLTIQLLLAPILAFKRSSNMDEYMVENERTRMRQNYVLQRALNNNMDKNKIGMTYVTDPLNPNTNPEELPALIVDYANMIRNDIILLDNSVETRTRKRGNLKVEKYNQVGPINEVPCRCELETKDPMFLDADHFPSSVETRACDASLCPNPYKCHPRYHNITVLKRNRKLRQTDELFEEDLPEDFPKHWVAIKKPVIVGCFCLRNYDSRS